MAIPHLERSGLLPAGVHECTIDELKARFGRFQASDRRPKLFAKLELFVNELRAAKIVRSLLVDGSFVTSKAAPNDIDLVAVVGADHDFTADLDPLEYGVLSKSRVRHKYGFDLLVAREDSLEYRRWTEFFQQVRLEPNQQKGILKVAL